MSNFTPVIGPYDIYSIHWGYRPIPDAKTPKEEKVTLDKWILEKYDDPIYQFNGPSSYDPTSQSEAVGDDAVKASQYGIANLEQPVIRAVRSDHRAMEPVHGTRRPIHRRACQNEQNQGSKRLSV